MQLFAIICNYMHFRAEHSKICKKFVYDKCAYFAWRKYVENMLEPRLQQIKSRGAFNIFWCSGVLFVPIFGRESPLGLFGDDGDGDGGGRIFPEHPNPIPHAPRDIISRKGKSLTPIWEFV